MYNDNDAIDILYTQTLNLLQTDATWYERATNEAYKTIFVT